MAHFVKTSVADFAKGIFCFMWLAFSLGWFYVYTDQRPWPIPIPLPEVLGASILYLFSPFEVGDSQAVIGWFVAFPIAAWFWLIILAVTSPYFGGRKIDFSLTFLRFAMASIPLSLPGPFLAVLAAETPRGMSWQHMSHAAIFETYIAPRPWVIPVYLTLAIFALIFEFRVYRTVFDLRARNSLRHITASLCIAMIGAAGIGAWVTFAANRFFY